jgi:hypothetical protein
LGARRSPEQQGVMMNCVGGGADKPFVAPPARVFRICPLLKKMK